jgi:phosphoserine/homoserine phosphotransferase
MLKAADKACLFRAPDSVKKEFSQFKAVEEYAELMAEVRGFLI